MHDFDGTNTHLIVLRKRSQEFCNDSGGLSSQRLINLAGLKNKISRQSMRKFLNEGSRIRSHAVLQELWRFFRDKHPNDTINARGHTSALDTNRIYHHLIDFYSIDSGEKDYLNVEKSLVGKYYFFREPWKNGAAFSDKLVIGWLEIINPNTHLTRDNVLKFTASTKIEISQTGKFDEDEFEGFVFFRNGNIFLIGKDRALNPVFIIFHSSNPYPTSNKRIEWLIGNCFAGIGVSDHRSLKVALHSTLDFQSFPKALYSINEKKLDFFDPNCLQLLRE